MLPVPDAITIDGAGSKSRSASTACLAVAVGPQHERALDGVAAAVPARARRAADVDVGAPPERDRPGRESAQAGRAVEELAHALPVVEAVAQLEQLAAAGRPGERGEEPGDGLVATAGRVVVVVLMAVTRGSRRARGRCCAAGPRWWSGGLVGLPRRAVRGGLIGGGLVAGLTGGTGVAAGEELDALGDDVDAGGVGAVLGLELVEQQAAVDGDLAPGLEVLRAGVRLGVEALDVEVAVVALLAGALDGDPQRADRGPVRRSPGTSGPWSGARCRSSGS